MLAPPRRGFPRYQARYRNFLITLVQIFQRIVVATMAKSVVAMAGVPLSVSAGRAMVAGMAMAPEAAPLQNWGFVNNVWGIKDWQGAAGTANGNWVDPVDAALMTMSFTPLHTKGRGMESSAYDMIVWGTTPRGTAADPLLDHHPRTLIVNFTLDKEVFKKCLMNFGYTVVGNYYTVYEGRAPESRNRTKISIDLV